MTGTPRPGTQAGLFRTASQICEIDLIPKKTSVGETAIGSPNSDSIRRPTMAQFWNRNQITGDNTRERPYSNIYQKVTTRSNTFRVYFMAQAIKKAKSVAPDQIDLNKDTVTGEYRGSALLERFLDFSSAERGSAASPFLDYADGSSPFTKPSLENFYHFRIIEMKQFSP